MLRQEFDTLSHQKDRLRRKPDILRKTSQQAKLQSLTIKNKSVSLRQSTTKPSCQHALKTIWVSPTIQTVFKQIRLATMQKLLSLTPKRSFITIRCL